MNSSNIKELGKVTYSDLEGKHKENKKKKNPVLMELGWCEVEQKFDEFLKKKETFC